jgi:hypothetical protein
VKPLVFAGPSLFGLTDNYNQIDFAAPAACGDIYKAVLKGRKTIALIDGIFETGPSVWHKEILFALSEGCEVLGCSSMGALRAAECYTFGMRGIGKIFEDYAAGRRTSDADVAVLHGPAETNFMPLTVPQVDVEATVDAIVASNEVNRQEIIDLVEVSRSIFYKERNWGKIVSISGRDHGSSEACSKLITRFAKSQKFDDAKSLLSSLNSCKQDNVFRGYATFQTTMHFETFRKAYQP